MTRIHLCTGLLLRDDALLLTCCRYPGEPEALWTLPGGRQRSGETIAQTVIREFREETDLRVRIGAPAYISESIDERRDAHVVNCTFFVSESDPSRAPRARDPKVVDVRFVPAAEVPALLRADVLQIPVMAALSGKPHPHYFSFPQDQIQVPFFSEHGLPDRSAARD